MVRSLSPCNSTSNLSEISNNGVVDIAFNSTPLSALSMRTRQQLARMLNCKKVLRSEEGYERDWRGIAVLSQQRNLCDETAITTDNPIEKVLQFWCKNNPETAKFGCLEHYLGIIDRWDVRDDIKENLEQDTAAFTSKQNRSRGDNQLSGTFIPNIITDDDVDCAENGLPLQQYDAFVLYADADLNYAIEIMTKLEENPRYNFKLYLKDRDFLAGVPFEHVELTRLIEDRCKHLIVVLTDDFLRSPENTFLVNYTQALQIQNKSRKIIPLIYTTNLTIPRTLKIYTHLKYSSNGLFNFWEKLAKSIRDIDHLPSNYMRDLHVPSAPPVHVETSPATISIMPPPPSININGEAYLPPDEQKQKLKKRDKRFLKRSSIENNTLKHDDSNGLRNAHSTSQLNIGVTQTVVNNSSLSDISITSETKKKKKWSKAFKKMFSRSATKLQEPA